MRRDLPLEGVRITDFSWLIAGPYANMLLGQMGAQIIKVESSARPDDVRLTTPFKDKKSGMNRSVFWAMNNACKYSVTINMNHGRAVGLIKKLVAISDIVVENFRPGQMEKWGLGYENLKQVKPDIVMVRTSIHGQTGPYVRQPVVGIFFQGATGFHDLVGWPDRDPAGIPNAYTDYIAPWFVAMGALTGLEHRRRTGRGVEIDVSQIETGPHFLAPAILDYAANGRVAKRDGNRSRYAAPNGVYRCRGEDRWCAISVCTEEQWRSLRRVLGEPAWAQGAEYQSARARAARAEELDERIEGWTRTRSPEEVVGLLQEAGVPSGVVGSGEDVMEKDPQLRARGTFRTAIHPEIGEYRFTDVPFRMSRGGSAARSAPCLGQDNEYVCRDLLGLSEEEFRNLVDEGVLK